MFRTFIAIVVCYVIVAAVASTAGAKELIYKCTNADGGVEYRQSPCTGKKSDVLEVDGQSPRDKADSAKRVWTVSGQGTIVIADACLEAWRPRLKDPDSGRIVDAGIIVASPNRKVIVAEGRARNGFGGMGVQYFLCDLDKADAIIGNGDPHHDLWSKADDIEKYPNIGLSFAFPGITPDGRK